jgi:TolA-binding protein
MKEQELRNKLKATEELLIAKPLSLTLNLLAFSYLTLLKEYLALKDLSLNYSMLAISPCILAEDFRAVSDLAENDIENAMMEVKFTQSIDPEDVYSYILEGIIKKVVGENPEDAFSKAIAFAKPKEKIALEKLIKGKGSEKFEEMININNASLDTQIEQMNSIIANNSSLPYPKLTLAELYLKNEDIDRAIKILNGVLSTYPSYPRALMIAYTVYNDYLKDNETAKRYAAKLSKANPISPYNSKVESSQDENEQAETLELENIFLTDNPIISFAKTKLEEIERLLGNEQEPEKNLLENRANASKEEPPSFKVEDKDRSNEAENTEIAIQPEINNEDNIRIGYDAINNKDYPKAIECFLKALKEGK